MSSPTSSGGDLSLPEEPQRSLSSGTKDATHITAPPDDNEPPLNRLTFDGGSDFSSSSDALVLDLHPATVATLALGSPWTPSPGPRSWETSPLLTCATL
ncbi:hypothetical protein MLD38_037385 [Melastoma candidum]|uniref:Uncharacterized protein n=1 Tax=Melastoma candidum TaxID=119954 RepID=A0ACB9LMN9_9MYRT|nr:hypothetical protein MLD38_037385 [Melastoma candidum]